MPDRQGAENIEQTQIVLGLLDLIERDPAQTQRRIASELSIALGLANAYLRRCVNKGLVKVRKTPTRRYAYFLTPKGFIEKSRLTAKYLSLSFAFFRQARAECSALLGEAAKRGWRRIALAGCSDLAEIATICAAECDVGIVAIVDERTKLTWFLGLPVVSRYEDLPSSVDAILVTNLGEPKSASEAAAAHFGDNRVLKPRLLKVMRNKTGDPERR